MAETLPGKSKVSPCLSTQACDPKRDPTLPGKSKVSPCLSTQACDPKRDPTLPGKSKVSPCLSTQACDLFEERIETITNRRRIINNTIYKTLNPKP